MNVKWVALIISIIVVVSGILCYFGRITGDQFMNIVMYILGLISGGVIASAYIVFRLKALEE